MITLDRVWSPQTSPSANETTACPEGAIHPLPRTVARLSAAQRRQHMTRRLRVLWRLGKRATRAMVADLTVTAREQSLPRVFAIAATLLWLVSSLFLGIAQAWQVVVQPAVVLAVGWVVVSIYDTQRRDGSLLPRKSLVQPNAAPELDIEDLDDRALVMLVRRAKEEIAMRRAFNFHVDT